MTSYFVDLFGQTAGPVIDLAAKIAIFGLALWLGWIILRRFRSGLFVAGGTKGRLPRLAVTDAVPVDSHRRIILVRRDDVEHLIMIGGPTDIVVETGISKTPVMGQQSASTSAPVRLPAQTSQPQAARQNAASMATQPTVAQPAPPQRPANVAARDAVIEAERGRPIRGNESLLSDRRSEPPVPVPPVPAGPPALMPAAPAVAPAEQAKNETAAPVATAASRSAADLDMETLISDLRLNPAKDR